MGDWGITPSELPNFLGTRGWRIFEQPNPTELRRRFLDPVGLHDEPLAPYEHVCLAER